MTDENDACKNTLPMKVWINQEDQKICRSCVLPIALKWYIDEFEERGKGEYAKRLRELAEKEDITPDELAEELDAIKEEIPDEELKARLKEFDCTIQINESSE